MKFNQSVFPGTRFGKLVVVKRIPLSEGKVLCKCDCGRRSTPNVSSLVSGRSSSCGCGRSTPGEGYGKIVKGAKFSRLTVIKRLRNDIGFIGKVKCKCLCGNIHLVGEDALVRGNTKSCGCLSMEKRILRNKESAKFNGVSADPRTRPSFLSWRSMLERCYNKGQQSYVFYGAVGVFVCKGLRESPFYLMDLIGVKPTQEYTLDRFPDFKGNYTCGKCKECKGNGWVKNVRWATRKEQALNRKSNVLLTAFGQTMAKSQWAEKMGLNSSCLDERLKRGWSVEKALTTPSARGGVVSV